MKKYDRICAILFLAIAVTAIVLSSFMPMGRTSKPGPGFLPFWVGVILALLSIFLFVEAGFRKTPAEPARFLAGEGRWPNVIWTAGSLMGYGFLIEVLGFVISTLILLLFLFRYIGNQKWWVAFTGTSLVTLAAHLIFKVGLRVQLPRGFF
jgi:putative tricarboxylic transport membrane protein